MIDANPDALYHLATRYWNRLKEFVDNHNEVSDYLLKRVQAEHKFVAQKNTVDFNALYQRRFTDFVMATHALVEEKLHHAPSSRCFFITPTEEQTAQDIKKGVLLDKNVARLWDFTDDVPVKFIDSINEIVQPLRHTTEWKKDVYTLDVMASRYIGAANDGMKFFLKKSTTEMYYRKYAQVKVRILAQKSVPEGPFEMICTVFNKNNDEEGDERKERKFLNAKSLDSFVEEQKKEFDQKYGKHSEEQK